MLQRFWALRRCSEWCQSTQYTVKYPEKVESIFRVIIFLITLVTILLRGHLYLALYADRMILRSGNKLISCVSLFVEFSCMGDRSCGFISRSEAFGLLVFQKESFWSHTVNGCSALVSAFSGPCWWCCWTYSVFDVLFICCSLFPESTTVFTAFWCVIYLLKLVSLLLS